MNDSEPKIGSKHSDYQEHPRDYREPRITQERLAAMKRLPDCETTRQLTFSAWLTEQVNELLSCLNAAMFRNQNSCATRGHRVAVHKSRIGALKCTDCGESITSAVQIRSSINAPRLSTTPQAQNLNGTNFWVDEAALDRKLVNRKMKPACWQ